MNNILNVERLALLVRAKRGVRGLREVSQEIGEVTSTTVSSSTLSRLDNGAIPDLDTFLALCDWLRISASELLEAHGGAGANALSIQEQVIGLLLGDNNLDETTAHALANVVVAVYRGQSKDKSTR